MDGRLGGNRVLEYVNAFSRSRQLNIKQIMAVLLSALDGIYRDKFEVNERMRKFHYVCEFFVLFVYKNSLFFEIN